MVSEGGGSHAGRCQYDQCAHDFALTLHIEWPLSLCVRAVVPAPVLDINDWQAARHEASRHVSLSLRGI
jgi:hypothetical protein